VDEDTVSILGNTQHKIYGVVYDLGKKTVGFAPGAYFRKTPCHNLSVSLLLLNYTNFITYSCSHTAAVCLIIYV
jgi:hypothetical protein